MSSIKDALWSPRGSALAAGALLYTLLVALPSKLARTLDMSLSSGSMAPLKVVPLCLGDDLAVVAAFGLLALALTRLPWPHVRDSLMVLLLGLSGVLHAANVVAYRVTGAPITWRRIQGKEGAKFTDLDLLSATDLTLLAVGVAVAMGLLSLCLRQGPRLPRLMALSRPAPLLLALALGSGWSLAQGQLLPRVYGLDEQPVVVLIDSSLGPRKILAEALTDAQWERLMAPSRPPAEPDWAPPRTQAPPKNVVVFLAEGIPYKHTGFSKRHKHDPTPRLSKRFRRQGLLFDQYYANWHASIQAIFSVVCSAFPPMRGDIVRIKPRMDCGELSEVMRERGLKAGLFHGGRFNFYNKLALLGRRAYSVEMDAEEMRKAGSPRRSNQWGIDDRAVVDATLEWVDSLPREQPFAALLIPITAHYPYWTPRSFRSKQKGKGKLTRFLKAVDYQDKVFDELIRGFEKRKLADDTLFIWLGDHGHAVDEPVRATPGVRMFYQPNLRTPLVLLNERMFPRDLKRRISHRAGSHTDLLPTMLDALGKQGDARHRGQSLLSDDFEPKRVFFAAFDGRFVGFIEEGFKFVLDLRTQRTEYYDLKQDPDEQQDLSAQHPTRMRQFSLQATRFARGTRARIDAAPVLDENVSVRNLYSMFREKVIVRLRGKDKQVVECERGGFQTQSSCPGVGDMFREHQQMVQGMVRRCLYVKVPKGQTVELSVQDPAVLDLLTGTVLAMHAKPDAKSRFQAVVMVDDKRRRITRVGARASMHMGHPKAQESLRFELSRLRGDDVPEVCLQLTALLDN